jgi:WD40 repeat protein
VNTLSYSSHGEKLAAATGFSDPFGEGQEQTIFVWKAESGEGEQSWKGPKSRVNAMSFSADGSALTLVEESKIVSTWSTESQKQLQQFPTSAHSRRSIKSAAFLPDGTTVVTSGLFNDLLVFWDTADGKEVRRIQVENSKGSILAISPNGTLLASGSIGLSSTVENRYDQAIHFWNISTGEHVRQIEPGTLSVTALAFSPDGRQLVSGMSDGTLLVWDAPVD